MAIGIRTRIALTLVALVAVTVAAIGLGVYAFVDASLRARLIADARQQVDYNLSVLLPGADPRPTDARAFEASGLPTAFALRGSGRVLADFGDGSPYEPPALTGSLAAVSPELRSIVGGGELGFAWQDLAGEPVLVIGGRQGAQAAIGRIIGPSFAREEIPDVVERLIGVYLQARDCDAERFVDTVHRIGIEPFKEAVYAHAD